MNIFETQRAFEFDVYPKRDIALVRGAGSKVWDADGREYIDCAAGHGVASLGHCHPAIVAAVNDQVETLITCPGTYFNDVRAKALEKLIGIAPPPLRRAFLCNSGTEAVEGAIKFARFATGKTEFICANRSYHGRTLGALSATFNAKYKVPFEPLVPGFDFVPLNNVERLEAAMTNRTAGIILEVVQGEGGIHVADAEFLRAARRLCDQSGALLIIDEIQAGFCRTGRMFACMHHDVTADIMCVAKAIAGGLPMGAILVRGDIEAPLGRHGSTFGGNPLCCAAAIAAIDVMVKENLAKEAARKGARVLSQLRDAGIPVVREIRGMGLMIGIELRNRARPYLERMLQMGVIALPTGPTVIRLLPPLIISDQQLDQVVDCLIATLSLHANRKRDEKAQR